MTEKSTARLSAKPAFCADSNNARSSDTPPSAMPAAASAAEAASSASTPPLMRGKVAIALTRFSGASTSESAASKSTKSDACTHERSSSRLEPAMPAAARSSFMGRTLPHTMRHLETPTALSASAAMDTTSKSASTPLAPMSSMPSCVNWRERAMY